MTCLNNTVRRFANTAEIRSKSDGFGRSFATVDAGGMNGINDTPGLQPLSLKPSDRLGISQAPGFLLWKPEHLHLLRRLGWRSGSCDRRFLPKHVPEECRCPQWPMVLGLSGLQLASLQSVFRFIQSPVRVGTVAIISQGRSGGVARLADCRI